MKLLRLNKNFIFNNNLLNIWFIIFIVFISLVLLTLNNLIGKEEKIVDSVSIEECGSSNNQRQCWEDAIKLSLDKGGLEGAFNVFGELYGAEPGFASSCHDFAHLLGVEAYEKYKIGEDFDLSNKTSYCGYGFYHGFMETLLLKEKDPTGAVSFCDFVDSKLKGQSSGAANACFHGIGHGLVDGSDPRAWGDPERMIAPGMEVCEKISTNETQLYLCTTGVYNSIEILSINPKYRLTDFRNNSFAFCETQNPSYQPACYTNMLPALMSTYKTDFAQITTVIEKIPEENSFEMRFGVISDLFHEYYRVNFNDTNFTENAVSKCRSFSNRTHLACIDGVAGGLMKHGEPEKEYVKALAFCGHNFLTEEEEKVCYEQNLPILGIWYSKEKVTSICNSVPQEYRSLCR